MSDRAQLCHRLLLKLVLAPKKVSLAVLNLAGVGWNEKEEQ